MQKYFTGIDNLEALKKLYKKLILENHPDRHVENKLYYEEIMKSINVEYEAAFKHCQSAYNNNPENKYKSTEAAADYPAIIEKLIHLEGIRVEIIGSWIWVFDEIKGSTYNYRKYLSEIGLQYASSKKAWFYAPYEIKKFKHHTKNINEIRNKYGSDTIQTEKSEKIAS